MAERRLRILAVDDDPDFLQDLSRLMAGRCKLQTVANASDAMIALASRVFDAVLLDLDLGRVDDGFELLDEIKRRFADLPVIMVTGERSSASAVKALRRGAADYIDKSPDLDELERRITRALNEQSSQRQNAILREEIDLLKGEMKGESAVMRDLLQRIAKVASSRSPALIVGETGTGKELVARALHRQGCPDAPFVAINCAEYGRGELFASKLFGTEVGAFTGSVSRPGVCEIVGGGVLFLDEITEIPPELQSQLLRMVEERVICRLGGTRPREFHGRIVASTNRNPELAVRDGVLRRDLFYRLQTYLLPVPPLRERLEDVPLLAEYFRVRKVNELKMPRPPLEMPDVMRLCAHSWPGNVRELQSEMERYVAFGRLDLGEERNPVAALRAAEDLLGLPYHEAKERVERQFERDYALPMLAAHGGNKTKAAAAMGISRQALDDILRRLGSR